MTALATNDAVVLSPADPRRSFRRWLVAIAILALVIRLVYAIWRRNSFVWGDPFFYHWSANLVADGEGFINPLPYLAYGIREQAADHPPLYLVYLAFWSLLGLDTPLWHALVSVPLGVASVVLIGLAGRRIAGPRVGLIAAAFAAVYPNVWGFDGMILSETMAILVVSATVLAAYRYRDEPSTARAAVLGALVGLAAMSRSELLLLSVLVVVPLVLGRDRRQWPRRLGRVAVAGVACVAVLTPWVAFNLSRFEQPVLLSAGAEITLSTATCDDTYYGQYTGYWNLSCPLQALADAGLEDTADQSERSEVYRESSITYIRDNLDRLPLVVLARWGRIVGLYKPVQQVHLDHAPEGRELPVAYASLFSFYVLAALSVAGVVALRRRGQITYPLLALPFIVWLVVTVMFAANRYRASAEVSLCLLAAVGVDAILRVHERLRDDPDDQVLSADGVAAPDLAAPTT